MTEQCVHHWIIEPPSSLYSRGVCRKCGEERMFTNEFPKNWLTADYYSRFRYTERHMARRTR